MSKSETIHIFIDETGTVSNAGIACDYGFGWVIISESEITKAEALLKAVGLDKIHMKNYTGQKRKLKKTNQIANVNLQSVKLMGGAFIRKDSNFAKRIVDDNFNRTALKYPEWVINESNIPTSNNLILSPKDMLPDQYANLIKTVRLQELAIMATRYPVIGGVLKHFGHNDIKIHLSAVIDATMHGEAVMKIKNKILSGLNPLIAEFNNEGVLNLAPPSGNNEITINVVQKSAGLFGLADYFAFVGQAICSDDPAKAKMGENAYSLTSNLFMPRIGLKSIEKKAGIFLRTAKDF